MSLLRAGDTAGAEGRSRERYRRAALGAAGSAVASVANVAAAIVSIRLTLGYLGAERYGLWMTINSLAVIVLTVGDLGLGNAVVSAIADASGKDDKDAQRTCVSSAFVLLSAIAVGLGCLFAVAYPFIAWPRLFNVTSAEASREAGPAAAALFACFALNLPVGVAMRTRLGLQEGYVNGLWQAAGSVLSIFLVVCAIHMRAGLPVLMVSVAGAPVVAGLGNALVLFLRTRTWLRPNLSAFSKRIARQLLSAGLLFFGVQLLATILYSSDGMIVAHVLGPEQVTQYMVPSRLFSLAPLVVGMVLAPLWPAYGEAVARGDPGWARRTFLRSLTLSLVVGLVSSVTLVVLGRQILALWVGSAVTPSLWLLVGMGAWTLVLGMGSATAAFLNGVGALRVQLFTAATLVVVSIPLKIFAATRFGLPGVIWTMVLSYVVVAVLPLSIVVVRLLKPMRGG